MIKTVIKYSNGMVMVFDEEGQQMTDYQGRFEEVRDRVLENAPVDAVFMVGSWRSGGLSQVSRGVFAGGID